ncbi:MAG TPA: PAS domain S-box protein [Prolixibacteraceae bacterium]|nr:PAS domain S-box protein [Prolixibacteraceae bacterium]
MKKNYRLLPAFVVLILGISFSVWVQFMQNSAQLILKTSEIDLLIETKSGTISHQLLSSFSSIEILHYFFEKNAEITRTEFQDFTLPILLGNPVIKAISWIPKVTHDERARFETELKKDYFKASFSITERNNRNELITENERPYYFPVKYIEPIKDNRNAVGYDIFSNDIRKATIIEAINKRKLLITPRIKLVQDTSGYSFLGLIPVYSGNRSLDDSTKTASLKGFVSAVFKVDQLIANALQNSMSLDIKLIIFDVTDRKREHLYGDESLIQKNLRIHKKQIQLAGRVWELDFIIDPALYKINYPYTYLLIGIPISLLLFLLLLVPIYKTKKNRMLSQKLQEEQKIREKTEQSLSENEEYNRALFEHTTIGLALTTMSGELTDINPSFAEIIGRTVEETLKLTYWEITPEKYREQEQQQLKRLSTTGKYGPFEKEYIHKDGHLVPVSLQGKIIERQGVKYIWSSVEDITERQQAGQMLRESEKRFSTTFHNSPVGINIFRLSDNHSVDVNEAYLKIIGYSYDEVVGSTSADLNLFLDLELRKKWMEEMVRKGKVESQQAKIRRKSGEIRDVLVSLERIEIGGEKLGLVTATDITERVQAEAALHESEERFRAYVEQAADSLFVHDFSGHFIAVNQQACKNLGYTREELMSMTVTDIECDFDLTKAQEAWSQIQPNDRVTLMGHQRRKDGSIFPVEIRFGCFDLGEKRHYIGQARDITERLQAEEALIESNLLIQNIINNSPSLIYVIDIEGKFQLVNQKFESLFNDLKDHIIGNIRESFMPKEIAERHRDNDLLVTQSRKPITFEEENMEPDGKHYFLTQKFPLFDSDNNIYAVGGISTDITERKEADALLRESEERFRKIFEEAPFGMAIASFSNGKFISANNSLCKMLGYASEELMKLTFRDVTHPDDISIDIEAIENLISGHIQKHITQKRYVRENGQIIWANRALSKFFSSDLETSYALAMIEDITERKNAEEELRKSEQKFQILTEVAPVGIFRTDQTGKTQYVNRQWSEISRLSFGEALNDGWLNAVHPDDRPLLVANWEKAVKNRTGSHSEYRFLRPDKSIAWVTGESIPQIDLNGDIVGYIGTINDITERKHSENALKESEEKYRSIYENSSVAILLTDLDGTILSANDFACKIFGRTEQEICQVGRNGVIDATDSRLPAYTEERKRTGKAKGELTFIKKDGTKFTGEISTVIFRDLEGNERTSMVIRDLTEQKLAEQEIKILNQNLESRVIERTMQLELANQELESFSYSISHDLRAPLRAIYGFSQILASRHRNSLNIEGKQYMDYILEASIRMEQLINDLLNYSRLGRTSLSIRPVSLQTILDAVHSDFRAELTEIGGKFTIVDELPTIQGDETLLRQIFSNLVGNAIKYRRTDTPLEITIQSERITEGYLLKITDNGIGIPENYWGKIFDVFQRLHSENKYPGTGIGLANVKKAVSILGGTINVESKPGFGSTFIIKFTVTNS